MIETPIISAFNQESAPEVALQASHVAYLQAKAAAKAASTPGFDFSNDNNKNQESSNIMSPTKISEIETSTVVTTTCTIGVVSFAKTMTPPMATIKENSKSPSPTLTINSNFAAISSPSISQSTSANVNPVSPVDLNIKRPKSEENLNCIASPPNKTVEEVIKAEGAIDSKSGNNNQSKINPSLSQSTSFNSSSTISNGKYVCNTCKASFPTPTVLSCHQKIHLFERNFRCDPCSVSFRTSGHLQKHKRSSGHFNKVSINAAFGEPSPNNPRPFYCGDCRIGFRIHGHLAKHLRSKSHIMKLENSGKLPIGMYAEMERLGTNFNEIDTSSCESSLESLKSLSSKLMRTDKISVDMKHTNGLLSPNHNEAIKEEPMEILPDTRPQPQERMQICEPEMIYRKSPEQKLQHQPPHIPIPNGIPTHVALNLTKPQLKPMPVDHGNLVDRRASFSSSGQDEPSTDSEAVRTKLNPILRVHYFDDYQRDSESMEKTNVLKFSIFQTNDNFLFYLIHLIPEVRDF